MTAQINLHDVATAKTSYLKGEWVSAGYKIWKAFDAELGCDVYVQLKEDTHYSVKNRIRDESKTRNIFKILMGTELSRRGDIDYNSEFTVMAVSYTGESFEKQDAKRAQIAKRMLTRFGITV